MDAANTEQAFVKDRNSILPNISAGLVVGILVVFIVASYAALIFSGDLDRFLAQGIGILLFGAFIIGVVVALTSTITSVVALQQDAPAVIMAVVAAAIASAMTTATPEQILATIVAAMMFSGILTGIFFWLLGRFNLGQLVRFVPYPVIGGFLAGTGWLIVVGAVGIMTNVPVGAALLAPDALLHWFPGLLYGLILYLVLRRFSHFLLLPGLILAGVALFYMILFFSGATLQSAEQAGWLLGPFPEGYLWQPVTGLVLAEADWAIVLSQAVTLGTIMLVSAIGLLMNVSGLEITMKKDFDLNRELRSAGLADILAGITGSFPGFASIGFSALGFKLGARSRIVGLTAAFVVGAALIVGAEILAVFPRVIAGGFLIFVGMSFLVEWLYDSFFNLSKLEYLLIWLILIVIAAVGFLEGMAVGIVVAAVFFVFNYSRVPVARHTLTGADYQSNVMRPPFLQKQLFENGGRIYILELQGYIFFGTAHRLLEQIRSRIEQQELPHMDFLLLDFRLVTGIDSSATLSMRRLMQMVEIQKIHLILTDLAQDIQDHWENEIFTIDTHSQWHIFPKLDSGVAWCEQAIIDGLTLDQPEVKPKTLLQQLDDFLAASDTAIERENGHDLDTAERMAKYVTRIDVALGQHVLHEGQQVHALYFVEEGQVIAKSVSKDGSEIELRTMETGTAFGEIGVYSHLMATADVVAGQESVLLTLTAHNLLLIEKEDPHLALAFHRLIAGILAEKLAQTNHAVLTLLS